MIKIKKIILIFLVCFLIYSLIPNVINYKNKLEFYNKTKKDYEKEIKKNNQLKTRIAKEKSLAELEKNIRNNLNLTKKNELVIIMPSIKITLSPTPTPIIKNWEKWKKIFFID